MGFNITHRNSVCLVVFPLLCFMFMLVDFNLLIHFGILHRAVSPILVYPLNCQERNTSETGTDDPIKPAAPAGVALHIHSHMKVPLGS